MKFTVIQPPSPPVELPPKKYHLVLTEDELVAIRRWAQYYTGRAPDRFRTNTPCPYDYPKNWEKLFNV